MCAWLGVQCHGIYQERRHNADQQVSRALDAQAEAAKQLQHDQEKLEAAVAATQQAKDEQKAAQQALDQLQKDLVGRSKQQKRARPSSLATWWML